MNADYTLPERLALSAVFASWDIDMEFEEIVSKLDGGVAFKCDFKVWMPVALHEQAQAVDLAVWRKTVAEQLRSLKQSAEMVLETEMMRHKTLNREGLVYRLHEPTTDTWHSFRVRCDQREIMIHPDGHSTFGASDHGGNPIVVSVDSLGVPVVKVWDDINKPDPTHTISMNGSQHQMSLEWAQTEIQNLLDRVPATEHLHVFNQAGVAWLGGDQSGWQYLRASWSQGENLTKGLKACELREMLPFLEAIINKEYPS